MAAEREQIQEAITAGTRMRVIACPPFVRLRTDLGQVTRKDEWGDYYIVRLDQPAFYQEGTGPGEELTEIRVDVDDLAIVQPRGDKT